MMLKTCLITGIVVFSVVSCTKTEYVNESEWYFINKTNKTIQVTYGDGSYIDDEKSFLLSSDETDYFIISSDSTRSDLCADDYDSPYSFYGATIKIYGIGTSFFLVVTVRNSVVSYNQYAT